MSYRNDPYDPKQVALLDPAALDEAVADGREGVRRRRRPGRADRACAPRTWATGRRSRWPAGRSARCRRPPSPTPASGSTRPAARSRPPTTPGRARWSGEQAERVLVEERVDVTLPYDRRPRGARHPLTTLMERIGDLFVGMGYEVAEGPEVELEWTNFDALNIPAGPPGPRPDGHLLHRPEGPGLVLRTHTSPVQARTMLTRQPPIYVVCPGRVYRTDELDATHTPGLPPGRGPGGRRGHHHGPPARHPGPLRPGDVRRRTRRPAGGRTTSRSPSRPPSSTCGSPQHRDGPQWVEWGGCGMVNPRVLRACGIDPEVYSGFAFGMGIERTLMFRHGVSDMRDMVEGDVRFTRAFGMEV